MNRQKLLLSVLLLIFAASVVYSYLRSPRQQQVAAPKKTPAAPATAPRKGTPAPKAVPGAVTPDISRDASRLHLELLDREQQRFAGYRRNIFSPIFREEVKAPPFKPLPPPPRPVPVPPPAPAASAPAVAPPPQPTPEQLAQQAADAELAKFVFLGFLKKGGEKTVFLSKNNEIFLAKKGSTLAQKFQVADLTDEAITIRSTTAGREIVIPLVENRALSTRRQ